MGKTDPKVKARIKRKQRIRKKILGTSDRPRLSVFRSSRHIYAQLIDDSIGRTVLAASTVEPSVRDKKGGFKNKTEAATHIGKVVAERALQQGIEKVVFDRNGFLYHGRVKALSDGAREAGLKF
jgi:large subunit ribosomal protein L18